MNNKWFSNRGQVIQIGLGVIACVFAGIKAFPDFLRSQFLTLGSFLFVFIAALVIVSVVQFYLRVQHQKKTDTPTEARIPGPAFSAPHEGKIFSCVAGLKRVGQSDGMWTHIGTVNAGAATFMNGTKKSFRNVRAFARYYDGAGHLIKACSLRWIDQQHNNVGFQPGEMHTILIAIIAKDTDEYFSLTDGTPLKNEEDAVTLDLTLDSVRDGVETVHFNLPTSPFIGVMAVK